MRHFGRKAAVAAVAFAAVGSTVFGGAALAQDGPAVELIEVTTRTSDEDSSSTTSCSIWIDGRAQTCPTPAND